MNKPYVRERLVKAKARIVRKTCDYPVRIIDLEKYLERNDIPFQFEVHRELIRATVSKKENIYLMSLPAINEMLWYYALCLGHILLGHLDFTEYPAVSSNLYNKLKRTFEAEAELFAKELIVPLVYVKHEAVPPITEEKINSLQKFFQVPKTIIVERLKEIGLL
ncbi:ImmA/IrrE family metallo-endopeptidase [Carboxydothermus ferrireducens]|uniref:IrrE N-terminal-like domain-containing protein n=1 Tax=Carboxydothermus ferrireducens DSM 11255 TaxID=1119529 RepID=A0ABX2RAW0_9THEO|nr:ImmA/IrrE family metallo-endopeptidase [Carboxydothermus ferrireducens]NYE57208.1 hypothetical protein [Carboxydothermus ferrireducens DSM 11255]